MKITPNGIANIEFTLKWKSGQATHTDCYYAKRVNFWRDIFPTTYFDALIGKAEGDELIFAKDMTKITPPFATDNRFDIELRYFDTRYDPSVASGPRFGRFYPKGLLRGIPGVFKGNVEPFRCIGVEATHLTVDFNHPLSRADGGISAKIHEVGIKSGDVGGACADWMEVITRGPGMQARYEGKPTDFFSGDPFRREDESDDAAFYKVPRLTTHIDDEAIACINGIYDSLLHDGMNVLDLMSSWRSHVPESLSLKSLTGLGLNREEMERNEQLTGVVIHDLNRDPRLPFGDHAFDAVICTVSVEYLVRPFEVFREVARVLMPGGVFIVTFSNRWFPPKTITLWREIDEFERTGLVIEYFLQSGVFRDIETYSMRGRPRPFSDKYFPQISMSDPVYAVWGRKDSS